MFSGDKNLAICDLETLGHSDNAVVLSMGLTAAPIDKIIPFSKLVNEYSLLMKFDAREQEQKYKRVVDKTVLEEFWLNDNMTSPESRRVSLYPDASDVSISTASQAIWDFTRAREMDIKIMDIGDRNAYDLSKLKSIFDQVGTIQPWSYRNGFEITSVLKAWGADRYAGINPKDIPAMIYHNPVHDAALDWLRFQYQAIEVGALEPIEGYDLEFILNN